MNQQEYLDQLVALVAEAPTHPLPSAQRRQAYLDQIVILGKELADQRGTDRTVAPNLALFEKAIMGSSKDILWRLAGATVERRRYLTPSRRAVFAVLEMQPDLLGPLGQPRDETAHSTLIAHFLDPRAAGDVGTACQAAFVGLLLNPTSEDEQAAIPEELDLAGGRVRAERHLGKYGRIDISLESERAVVFIEVKVDASERAQQLSDYASALKELCTQGVREGLLVFLTADSEQKPSVKTTARHITFRDLLKVWLPVAVSGRTSEHLYLSLYLKTIALHLYSLAEADTFDDWSLRTQRAALAFLETELEFA